MNDMHTVRKESFKTHVPHRFPEDNCVYHAFDTESTLKKCCGNAYANQSKRRYQHIWRPGTPNCIRSATQQLKIFRYVIIDRCKLPENSSFHAMPQEQY